MELTLKQLQDKLNELIKSHNALCIAVDNLSQSIEIITDTIQGERPDSLDS